MDAVRYKPGEAFRWLEIGAEDIRKNAQRKGQSLVRREGERNIGRDVRQAAGALMDMGKSALADLMHKQALANEYILLDDRLEIVNSGRVRGVPYDDVQAIRQRGDRYSLILDQGSIPIKPTAHIVSGKIKVPVGWSRNGMEVPFEVLI
ncbi:MAG TPA: hypothetical protein VEX38_06180, partial [Fimbriimonadaceae bacterium]|nr:hypothetical protein [Fimbriimonadaceae bacterium]